MDLVTLENAFWKVDVAPSVGASIANCFINLHDTWQPLMRQTQPEVIEKANPSSYSSFTLAPFSGRLKEARFVFEDKVFQLRANPDGNTQHGDVRSRPWEVLTHNQRMLEVRLTTQDFPDFNFPFPFVLLVIYMLDDHTFTTHFRLTNTGNSAMPAGLGIHPYFTRFIGTEEVRLQFSAEDYYLTENLLPTGERQVLPPELDFTDPRAVARQDINHTFRNFKDLKLHYPDFSLAFDCDPVFEHLVVYTPPDGSLAVEPVTNAPDGFNLLAQGLTGTGVRVLGPGEVLEGSIHLRLDFIE